MGFDLSAPKSQKMRNQLRRLSIWDEAARGRRGVAGSGPRRPRRLPRCGPGAPRSAPRRAAGGAARGAARGAAGASASEVLGGGCPHALERTSVVGVSPKLAGILGDCSRRADGGHRQASQARLGKSWLVRCSLSRLVSMAIRGLPFRGLVHGDPRFRPCNRREQDDK